jgi:hypothetical protein
MKRLKRILKWTWIVAGVATAVLLIVNAYFVWSTGSRLERRLVELRQAGDPVQITDFAHAPIPPEKNADSFLRRAADDLDATQKELLAMYPKVGSPTGAVSPADGEKLEKVFAAYPAVIPLLEQAADCPDSDPQLDCTLPASRFLEPFMDRTSKHRLIYRVLRARSAMLLSKGRADEALANQVLALRLTRRWWREPSLIGYLVTVACEQVAMDGVNQVLQAGPVSPSARQALDSELALHDTMQGYTWALRSERAFSLSSIRELPGTRFWLMRGFSNDVMSRCIDLYDWYLEMASRSYAQVVAARNTSPPPGGGTNFYGPLVTLLIPSLDAVRPPAERTRAVSRSLRILNAIQTRVPPGSDLVPKLSDLGLPAETTIDPFNGEPMHVKRLPEGWMVYSVGTNLIDDGGIPDGKSDVGVGPIRRDETKKKP